MSGPAGTATRSTRPYFPELDGVRAIATLLVMSFHWSQQWWVNNFMLLGQTGVDLFFVLSGFLITTILLQAEQKNWHEVRNFYVRRTLRIFPLYYGFLILLIVFGVAVSKWFWFYGQNIALGLNLPFHGPSYFWSLASEEQFYLVWPFLVLFFPRRWLQGAMWTILLLSIVMRLAFLHTPYENLAAILGRPDGLIAGGLLAYYYARGMLQTKRNWLLVLGAVAMVLLGAEIFLRNGTGDILKQMSRFFLTTTVYVACMGLVLITGDSPVHRVLRSKVARAIGRVSYGLYVYHPLIFDYVSPRLHPYLPMPVSAVICFALSYLLAAASFYGFEKRFTNLKGKLAPEPPFVGTTA